MGHFNRLTPAQAERLAIAAEEMAEATQEICKILRHGLDSSHPDAPDVSNKERLERELGDVLAAMALLVRGGEVSRLAIDDAAIAKLQRMGRYMHHSYPPPLIALLYIASLPE